MRTVIIGGVAAGAAVATRLRRLDEKREIVILEKGSYPSFANCALPYYLGGEVCDRNELFAASPEYLRSFFKLDLRLNCTVFKLDLQNCLVFYRDEHAKEQSLKYDDLVIATGTSAVMPPFVQGAKRVRALKDIPDVDFIKELVSVSRRVLIVGAGAIGLETAENLRAAGLKVTLCEKLPHVLPKMDKEIAFYAQEQLRNHGISVRTNCEITSFKEDDTGLHVTFDSEVQENFDFAVICAGVKPNTAFALSAELKADARGYLLTDSNMRCSDPHVYAAGDVATVPNLISNELSTPLLATPISQEVRALCAALTGHKSHPYAGHCGAFVVKIFDIAVGACGISEHECQKLGFKDAVSISTHGFSHVTFYPNATRVHIKLCFSKQSGLIFGAQVAGEGHAVVDAINRIAAVIGMHGTVEDLRALDHAYAPPYSSTRDPVIMSAAVAENVLDGLFTPVSWDELSKFNKAFKLDVRPEASFRQCHPQGFVNIPASKLRERVHELPQDREILISCMVGQTAYVCARILQQLGFNKVYVLTGSLLTLKAAGVELIFSKE